MEEPQMPARLNEKIIMVTSLLPYTHYSQYLCQGIHKRLENGLVVYADNLKDNLQVTTCGNIKLVWGKCWAYVWQIFRQARKDRPSIVHLQHEINMYGGTISAALFPLLVFILKINRIKVVVTVHAVVERSFIDINFIKLFRKRALFLRPWMATAFFYFLYKSIGLSAHRIIVHTHMLKKTLISDYGVLAEKIRVIPHGVPQLSSTCVRSDSEKYFLCFGYMARRKGAQRVIEGFANFMKKRPGEKVKLVLAGGTISGQEFAKQEIMQLVSSHNLEESFEYRGFVGKQEIQRLFANAYAIIVPAAVSISASGPLAQAFGYGKCVLASKVGNLCEEINDGQDGFLVDNSQWESVFEKISDNPALVEKVQQRVREKARQRNWGNIAEKHLAIYQELL